MNDLSVDLDANDRLLLQMLERDARLTNARLAEPLRLSPSAVSRRIQRLEAMGAIMGYGARINPQVSGKTTLAFIEIRLASQRESVLEEFERAVQACPAVCECHLMTGEADYLLRVAVTDTVDYERIYRKHIASLPHVVSIKSAFAMRSLKMP